MPSHKAEDMVSPTSAQGESEDTAVPAIQVQGPAFEPKGQNAPDEAYETSSECGREDAT